MAGASRGGSIVASSSRIFRAACSVLAGPYVHMVDVSFAIPAALVLASTLAGRAKSVAILALSLLAVPWILAWITKKLFLATLFVVAALLLRLHANRAVAIGTWTSIAASIYLLELVPPAAVVATTIGSFSSTDLAQRAWHAYVAQLGSETFTWTVVKVPTWAALVGILAASFAALRKTRLPAHR